MDTEPLVLAESDEGTVTLEGPAPAAVALSAGVLADAGGYLTVEGGHLVVCGQVRYRPVGHHSVGVIVYERVDD